MLAFSTSTLLSSLPLTLLSSLNRATDFTALETHESIDFDRQCVLRR